jgi:hypothetical protein
MDVTKGRFSPVRPNSALLPPVFASRVPTQRSDGRGEADTNQATMRPRRPRPSHDRHVSSAQQNAFVFWSFAMRSLPSLGSMILSGTLASAAFAQAPAASPHNVVLFVADGLRFRMVDDRTAPTMAAIARDGVTLRNSHALFPTFTTANASSMATGHMLGDTGDFANTIYAGFEVPGAGNSLTPFLEN